MNQIITDTALEFEPAMVEVDKIIVRSRLRNLNDGHVKNIQTSMQKLGGKALLQPIVLSNDFVLADGAHRLEAAKRNGWEYIPAWVSKTKITSWDIKTIEAEANKVRRDFTPIELHEVWLQVEQEVLKKAKEAQAVGFANLKQGTESPVIENYNNRETERTSVAETVKETFGISKDQLDMVGQIKDAAISDSQPEEIRKAALKAIEKLDDPESGAKVTTIFNALVGLKERLAKDSMSKEELRFQDAKKRIDLLVERSTGIAVNLVGAFGQDIQEAITINEVCADDVEASINALIEAVAKLVSITAMASGDPVDKLQEVAPAIHKLLQTKISDLMIEAQQDARGVA